MWQWSICTVILLFLYQASLYRGEVLVVQADTDVAFYVNGVETFPDTSSPVLPMNGVRRINMGDTNVRIYRISRDLAVGDLMAMQVNSRLASVINVTDALGRNLEYPAYVGLIVVAEEGSMTTSAWKCSTQREGTDDLKTPFQMPAFNDSLWPAAFEQPDDCCPWRDPLNAWERYGARWLGLQPSTFAGNISGPREMYCRFIVTGSDLSTRLPMEETRLASVNAPTLQIVEVKVSTSISKIDVSVDRTANVYCGVIDVRYELRVPTHNELKEWGVSSLGMQGSQFGYQTIGDTEFTNEEIDYPALIRLDVADLDACQTECSNAPECAAIVYWAQGFDIVTSTNCKLMNASYNASIRLNGNNFASLQLKERILVPTISTMTYSGMLLPGTLYNVYCSVEDAGVSGLHSNMSTITATRVTQRTEGCTDCGSTDPPAVSVLGGWAKQNTLGIVAASSRTGRVFCHSRAVNGSMPFQVTAEQVQEDGFSNLATVGGQSIVIIITGLATASQYQVACTAEADGGLLSTQAQIDVTRRLINTSATEVTISGMTITRGESNSDPQFHVMVSSIQAVRLGYFFCQVFPSENMRTLGVPDVQTLEEIADRGKVTDLQNDVVAEFGELDPNISYEIWCTARYDDFSNETDAKLITTPYPVVSIVSTIVGYQTASLTVAVSKSPGHVFCNAYPWALRPTTERPTAPTYDRIVASPFSTVLELDGISGTVVLDLEPLSAGTYYDLYCYSEYYRPPPPPGAILPPRQGMTNQEILETRYGIRTMGPQFDELGWECVSGRNCSIDNILGVGVSAADSLMVRADECPGRCRCSGVVDPNRKGGSCSAISQDMVVVSGVGLADKRDPRGAWCYVPAGSCSDEEYSVFFPSMTLSYKVCTFSNLVGPFATSGPEGFPNNGLALRRGSEGRAYDISTVSMVVPGASYSLCWCNGTESECRTEGDFAVRLGALHVAGPSLEQRDTNLTCRAGLPCVIRHFDGHALEEGSRLVVLPADPRGCLWRRASLADVPGLVDFPNLGVSETFNKSSREYSYYSVPLIIEGGAYNLCWCGPPARTWNIAPGQDYRIPDGITPVPCPSTRADDGGLFLSPAGKLVVIGPKPIYDLISCRLGAVCRTPLVQGTGLQGSDRVMALKDCGVPAQPPVGWADGVQTLDDQWVNAGWATDAADFTATDLFAFGVVLSVLGLTTPAAFDAGGLSNLTLRGIYGFPNFGVTVPHATPGYFSWEGPTWAFAGTYQICWCGNDATVTGCQKPQDFLVPIGFLEVTGPGVLPFAAQMFTCIRQRQCELTGLVGTQPPSSKLLVATHFCGEKPLLGMPRKGQSLPSVDGSHYAWGPDRVLSNPGRYSLCWCAAVTSCDAYQDFESYAAVLQVKAPLVSPLTFFCPLSQICNLTGISGEGLNNGDQVMVLTKCGEAVTDPETFPNGAGSLATFDDGGSFTIPAGERAGTFQICWCAAEQLCLNSVDYSVTLGRLNIGGPDDSVTYRCFEWEPCSIEDLEGYSLADGDRLIVVPDGTDCFTSGGSPRPQTGFPNGAVSLPATSSGKRFSWGPGLVRTVPGIYAMCWCHAPYNNGTCTEEGPFTIPGGVLRVGDSKEFQYVTRPEDNPPRQGDDAIALLLAIPLPLLFFGAICFGIKKLIGRKLIHQDETHNPWAERRGLDHMQKRSKMRGDVQEVAETRASISRLADSKARTKDTKPKDGVLALYSILKSHAAKWVKKKTLKRANATDLQMGHVKSNRSMGSNTTETSSGKQYQNSIDVESSDDDDLFGQKPKAPPKATPKPPSLDFWSVNDPRLLHMLDEDSQPHTLVSYDLD